MADVINWFQIPAHDLDRACAFYAAVIGARFDRHAEMPNSAFFVADGEGVGGEITCCDDMSPGPSGVLIYLNAPSGVADAVARVQAAGGQVVMPCTSIGPHGFIAVIRDTEGNSVGLHNMEG
ncbi:MAG: VOC family protein [Chthonomonadales bacterium]|nr:VOC family protein [Chthonomonadales bacterium]